MDRGDGPHMNFFNGVERRRRRLNLVEAAARNGQFNEDEIAWLRHVVSNGLEHEAIAYLTYAIEHDNDNDNNVVFMEGDLDHENEGQDADEEPQGDNGVYQHVIDHPLGPPDILNRESDTESEDEEPVLAPPPEEEAPVLAPLSGEERRRQLALVEDIAQSGQYSEEVIAVLRFVVSHGLEQEAVSYLRNYIVERGSANNSDNHVIADDGRDSEDEDQEAHVELQGDNAVYQPVTDHPLGPPDILDRDRDTESEGDAPVLAPSSRPMPGGSRRWLRGQDDWESHSSTDHEAPGGDAVLQAVSSSDTEEEEHPDSAPCSSLAPERSQKRKRDEDDEDNGSSSKHFRH